MCTPHRSLALCFNGLFSLLYHSPSISVSISTPPPSLSQDSLSLFLYFSLSSLSLYFTSPSLSLSLSFTLSCLSLYNSHILFRRNLLKVTVTSPTYFPVECSWRCTDGAEDVLRSLALLLFEHVSRFWSLQPSLFAESFSQCLWD